MRELESRLKYSVVIPAHNEAESLPRLLAELHSTLNLLAEPYEIIVVDDGSTDETADVLAHLSCLIPELRVIRFDRNYGQSAAFDAGFRSAQGEIVITLDADGQNPPSEIPKLVQALGSADLVCGWRKDRKDSWLKRVISKFANAIRSLILKDGIHDSGCSLKAFRLNVARRLKLFHGLHRFIPALALMDGMRVVEIPVKHLARNQGRSHYGLLNRLLGPCLDLIFVYWMRTRSRPWKTIQVPTQPLEGISEPALASNPDAITPAPWMIREKNLVGEIAQ